jgi:aminoglycoside phosphotransferase (APT) family kinase protein
MLSQRQVVPYLLQRNLLSPAHIVAGDVVVTDISRRHHNYKVTVGRSAGYVIKQGIGHDRIAALTREAAIYTLLAGGTTELGRYLPHCYTYDAEEHVLVLELVGGAQNLREYHQRGHFAPSLARKLGTALGTLHHLTQAVPTGSTAERDVAAQPPWILSVHRATLKFLQECSSANVELVQIMQQFPLLCDMLDALRGEWRTEALIHRDIRWDNCLVFGRTPAARTSRLKIVDWEIASLGDPSWDIGSVFSDFLSFWLFSIPVTGEMSPDRFLELARYPLEKMQPALHAFWLAYVQRMGLDRATADRWLVRSCRYLAARLLQTAFEQMQMSVQLTGNVVCMLQLSFNILQRPHEGAVQLLGITPQGMRLP